MKNPLLDTNFLLALDNTHNKIIYAKVISLTRDEQPIEAIEGVVQSGSINIDGASAVRRSCNLTMTTKLLNINEVYWGFSTKIKLEIGVQNTINPTYDNIIWFKQGIYILTDFKTSQQVNNYTITLQGKDKMCLLNGDISGHFNAETNLKVENIVDNDGNITEVVRPIKYIIREMIHHYAQEPWANIVINNLEDYGLEMLDNHSENNYYLWRDQTGKYVYLTDNQLNDMSKDGDPAEPNGPRNKINESCIYDGVQYSNLDELPASFIFINGLEEDANGLIGQKVSSTINNGQYHLFKIESYGVAGYRRTDLTYDKELIAAAGDTVTSILDKLVKMLGSFEYFYNLDGQFVFQAKDTYLNTVWSAAETLDTAQEISYINPALMRSKTSYYFENGQLITTIANNPNLLNVRNDFTIWGKKKTTTGSEIPIHARYAIDKKPLFYCKVAAAKELENNPNDNQALLRNIYMTQEGFELIKKMAFADIDEASYHNRHPLPNAFRDDADNWWNIEDWAEYYKAFVGSMPTNSIKMYQAAGTEENPNQGYSGNLYFANGLTIAPGMYGLGTAPFAVVDIERLPDDPNECIPASFEQVINNRLIMSHNAFMHRFNSCNHKYSYFLQLAQDEHYESYFYRPTLDFSDVTEFHSNSFAASIYASLLEKQNTNIVDWRELIYLMAQDYYQYNHDDDFELNVSIANREFSKLFNRLDYYSGKTGYEQYYHDIEGFWRLLYDKEHANDVAIIGKTSKFEGTEVHYDNDGWNVLITEDPTSLLFWFDFYETDTSAIGRFSVPAIGQRTKVVQDDDVRVIVYPDVPDIVYLYEGETITEDDFALSSNNSGYSFFPNPSSAFTTYFTLSIRNKSAKETMDNLVYNYSHTNDNISLTTIPIYYLQPNSIIHVHEELSHINGYYEVTKITLPLTYNGTMNISAVKIPQQIY